MKMLTLLLIALSRPALACGTCAIEGAMLHHPFVLDWLALVALWLAAVGWTRSQTGTLTSEKGFQFMVSAGASVVAGGLMLGLAPLYIFLLAWFMAYLKSWLQLSSLDSCQRQIFTLSHILLLGLLLTAGYQMTLDQQEGERRKMARAGHLSFSIRYLREVASSGRVSSQQLLEMARDPRPRARASAYRVMGYTGDVTFLPAVRAGLRDVDEQTVDAAKEAQGRLEPTR